RLRFAPRFEWTPHEYDERHVARGRRAAHLRRAHRRPSSAAVRDDRARDPRAHAGRHDRPCRRWQVQLFQTTPAAFHGRADAGAKLTAELRDALKTKSAG